MYARVTAGQTGFDITFPASTDIPGPVAINKILPLDLSLIPNQVNLGTEWSNPGYDPGNAHSMPYMWWTTGVAYDTAKIKEAPTSWKALWDEQLEGPHRDAGRPARGVRRGAHPASTSAPNTVDDGELDQALALLKQQHPLVRLYSVEDQHVFIGRHLDPRHGRCSVRYYTVQQKKPSVEFYIPRRAPSADRTRPSSSTGAKNPVAANLFINSPARRPRQRRELQLHRLHGPERGGQGVHRPRTSSTRPGSNPDKATVDKLQELLDLGLDLDKYASRWTELTRAAEGT